MGKQIQRGSSPYSDLMPSGTVRKVAIDFSPRKSKQSLPNKSSSSVHVPRNGSNYFRGDCITWPSKSERTKLLTKYEEWDLRYGDKAMSFRQVDEWGRFIEAKSWQFFCTFTTRHEMTAKSARRAIETFCEVLSNDLRFSYSKDSFECFWVIEPHAQYGKEGVHIHALVSLPKYWRNRSAEKIAFKVMLDTWQRVTGGRRLGSGIVDGTWNRVDIQAYRGVSACRYTVKYLTKSLVDWDYFCTFNNEIDEANLLS